MSELTAGQVLAQVDGLLPNACTREEKLRWLRQAAGTVIHEALQPIAGTNDTLPEELDEDTALPDAAPYEELYRWYVEAQIHYAGGDMTRCNNALSLWNRALAALQGDLLRGRNTEKPQALRLF